MVGVATKLLPLIDDDFSLLKFLGVSYGEDGELNRRYFYCHAFKKLNIDHEDERTKNNFRSARKILLAYDMECIKKQIKELNNTAIAKFKELKNEHMQDVLDVSGRAFDASKKYFLEDDYHGNVEGDFERRLLCVMLLKSINKFEKNGELKDVEGIGGGYYCDGDNFGITFTFNGVKYCFSDSNEKGYVRVPHGKEQCDTIKRLNDCCFNRYLIEVVDEAVSENAKDGEPEDAGPQPS